MKRRRRSISDLNSDVLKVIIIFAAKSADGAATFARATSICKLFKELANDTDILKAVEFSNVMIAGIDGSFWQSNGLLIRCARAGNVIACNLHLKHVQVLLELIRTNVRVGKLASRVMMNKIFDIILFYYLKVWMMH
ncbi:unnamed protein product [Ilex paraguariensis]|uniref:Uncharacterized protein n=1 Tax=Ilex paraguariensis TaxID=185542 RepID=A0ABC8RRW3_9AQUA